MATAERQNLTATWKKLVESKVNSFGDSNALSVVRGKCSNHFIGIQCTESQYRIKSIME